MRHLAQGFDRVSAVEIAISASNQASAGASVTQAILSYVGRTIRLWRGGRWEAGHGWGDLRSEAFRLSDGTTLNRRLVALADVPDLALLPDRLPGRPAVTFRAGTELRAAMVGLWLAGWLVRGRMLRSLAPWGPALRWLQSAAAGLGGDRSGMVVRLFGLQGRRRVERRWTLIAERGDGPEIPALAAPLLIDRLASGSIPPGALDAGEVLTLEAFAPVFATLAVRHEEEMRDAPPPLYARVLGDRFETLPPSLQRLHGVLRDGGATGRATVRRGGNPLARAVAALVGFPPAGEHELHVRFEERDGVETWTRTFSRRAFRSRLSQRGGRLNERFGLLSFDFELPTDPAGLAMSLCAWRAGPLPLPRVLAPRSAAREWQEDGRFHFDVPISLPLLGLVVHYWGWLEPLP